MHLLLRGLWFPPHLFAWHDADLGADRGQFRRHEGESALLFECGDRRLERRANARSTLQLKLLRPRQPAAMAAVLL